MPLSGNNLKTLIEKNCSNIILWLCILVIVIINIDNHRWTNPKKIIDSDVCGYYAYLPALLIHKDLEFKWFDANQKYKGKVWFLKKQGDKKRHIVYTSGLAMLYLPFFTMAHLAAVIGNYESDGYSLPYRLALVFASIVYLCIGLFYLRKLLLKYFSQLTISLVLILILFGTNLLYYSFMEPAMSHVFSLSLFIVFLYYLEKWFTNSSTKNTLVIGILLALISLVRPTNAIIAILFLLWNITSMNDMKERFFFLWKNAKKLLIILFIVIILWIPQFLYWKYVSGNYLMNPYSENAYFFWLNPEISNVLFSYRKGWLVYTPVMLFSIIGIVFISRKATGKTIPVITYLILNIWIISSWYMWFYGGSFGHRAFIDLYGIMAFPLAAIIDRIISEGIMIKAIASVFLVFLLFLNLFQTKQATTGAIHWNAMTKRAYWETFGKLKPTPEYFQYLDHINIDSLNQKVKKAKMSK